MVKNKQNNKINEIDLEEKLYNVEAIRRKKKIRNKWHYLIKWVDYPENQNTWEPKEYILCSELLEDFEKRWKEKQKIKKEKKKNYIDERNYIVEKEEIKNDNFFLEKKTNRERNDMNFIKPSDKKQECVEDIFNNSEINNIEENENKGSIEFNIPKRILSAKFTEDKSLKFLVTWKKKNGVKPTESYVSNSDLKSYKYFDLIIDFYESRTRFQNEENELKKTQNDSANDNKYIYHTNNYL